MLDGLVTNDTVRSTMDGLTRAGDYGYPGLTRFVTAIELWINAQIRIAYDRAVLPDGHWRLFMGAVVWGDEYVDRFLKYCVPSLLAPGNIDCMHDATLVIHTDGASADRLGIRLSELLSIAEIDIEIHVIPQHLIDQVADNGANKYWLLGCIHNLHIQQAKYRSHAYHMLMPDHVYALGYFSNLDRLRRHGKQAVVQAGLSTNLDTLGPRLTASHCVFGPRRLAAMAVENMHPLVLPYLMNGHTDYPPSLCMVMVGEKELQIVSPHISIVYLSHEVLMRAPMRMPNTIDAQLPFFIPDDVEAYMPGPHDGMAYIEVSPADKASGWDGRSTLEEFCCKFWIMTYCHRPFERFFGLTTRLPFPKDYVPPIEPMFNEDIEGVKARVRKSVSEMHEKVRPLLPAEYRIDPILRLMMEAA